MNWSQIESLLAVRFRKYPPKTPLEVAEALGGAIASLEPELIDPTKTGELPESIGHTFYFSDGNLNFFYSRVPPFLIDGSFRVHGVIDWLPFAKSILENMRDS